MKSVDFLVVGGGIAGASAAAHLAPYGSVTLVEAESTLAYHTTGRSAALFVVNYGAEESRRLSAASRPFLESPPEGATHSPLLTDRGLLWVADHDQVGRLTALADAARQPGFETQLLDAEETLRLVPALRKDRVAGGLYEPTARDIDVGALHQAYIRIARHHGTTIAVDSPVTSITRGASGWEVVAGDGAYSCGAVVNASGAWGDIIATMAGVEPIGLQPMRRTAFMVPGSEKLRDLPTVIDTDNGWYFKPDGVQILCSLSEENPSDPCDPKPEMEDVALAIERINAMTSFHIRTVNSQWVGLRTFSPDRNLVVGEDPEAPGFFWLVGQGGIGIASSPGYGELLACLVTGEPLSEDLTQAGVEPEVVGPARFRT